MSLRPLSVAISQALDVLAGFAQQARATAQCSLSAEGVQQIDEVNRKPTEVKSCTIPNPPRTARSEA